VACLPAQKMLEIQVLSENRMMDGKREGWGGGELAQRTKIRGLTLIGNLPNSAEGVERGGYGVLPAQAVLVRAAHCTAANYCQLLLLEYSFMTQITHGMLGQCSRAPKPSPWPFHW
jgi:hypothetical protein